MNNIINDIYTKNFLVGRSGKIHKLSSAISQEESELLFNIIDNNLQIIKTLEIGCAHGLSSLVICLAIQGRIGASHTIIDPFENSHWDGVGIKNLETAKINFFKLIEQKSEFALPRILEEIEIQSNMEKFDFIFIDGWHTFDHTLLDCFYATRLLKVGGYLAIDDVSWPSVRSVFDYISKYPCYVLYDSVNLRRFNKWKRVLLHIILFPIPLKVWARVLQRNLFRRIFEDMNPDMVVLKKIGEDDRTYRWHNDLF